jgi:FAD/FMN-containing dehydrogenase
MAEKELIRIVGRNNLLNEPRLLEEFSTDTSFSPAKRPRCIVRPQNTDEVQAIVKWASESGTPLVPVSSGVPHYRGDTVPGTDGAVIVDLSRMKRIIRIDIRNKLAMVEPGVTFGELQVALEKQDLGAYMPLFPRATKSVIGSLLEREPITMPAHHWDSTDPFLCAEVVFGTGDKFRTGEASGPDTVEEQWELGKAQMNPFGHSHADFQRLLLGAQGTMGIVTWATTKCRSLSKISRALLVPSDDLEPLVDLIYQPLRFRLGGNLFILNDRQLACLLGTTRQDLPPWVIFISFEGYGVLPEEKVEYEEADFLEMVKSKGLKAVEASEITSLLSKPSRDPYWKMSPRGGFQEVFFLTTIDKAPKFIRSAVDSAAKHGYPLENIGIYIQPIVQGTSGHCELDIYYDPANMLEREAVKRLSRTFVEVIAARGGFFSRPYSGWQDIAYAHAVSTASWQKKIKGIFDPKVIMNPGKLCF